MSVLITNINKSCVDSKQVIVVLLNILSNKTNKYCVIMEQQSVQLLSKSFLKDMFFQGVTSCRLVDTNIFQVPAASSFKQNNSRQQVFLKCQYFSVKLHGITSCNSGLLVFIIMRTLCFKNYCLYLLQIYYYRQDNKFVPATRFQELQYLDLDLECDASGSTVSTAQNLKSPERVQATGTVYKTVDFVKTVAFNRTRQEVEEVRKQGTAAADL